MTTIIDTTSDDLGLRERKKQQTRTAIHEAAFRLIDAQGLEATTVDQICQEADVSSRTFFNYFPSKAAAALELPATVISPEIQDRFRSARGSLVDALCDAIGSSTELGPSHAKMKQLIHRRPELLSTLSQLMLDMRTEIIALATERASSPDQAELAVGLVMGALARVMHDPNSSDAPLADRLRDVTAKLVGVYGEQLVATDLVAAKN
jgi:AcrR family transcriptional regulator